MRTWPLDHLVCMSQDNINTSSTLDLRARREWPRRRRASQHTENPAALYWKAGILRSDGVD